MLRNSDQLVRKRRAEAAAAPVAAAEQAELARPAQRLRPADPLARKRRAEAPPVPDAPAAVAVPPASAALHAAPEEQIENEPALSEGVWPAVAAATAQFFRDRAQQQVLRTRLRRRIDVEADPLYLQRSAGAGALATWGVDAHCEGDRRFLKVQQTLDSLHQERTVLQKMWHYHMLCACLPHIYRKDWPRACRRVLQSLGLREMRAEVMIMTPRRFGKTTCVSMLVAALLLCVPGIKISVISTGGRASGKLKEVVLGFINGLGEEARRRIVGQSGEKLYLAAEPLPPGVTASSALAHARRTLLDTSFMEVLPNNPDGAEMGIDLEVRKFLKATDATRAPAARAWREGAPVLDSAEGPWAYVHDVLTWLHRYRGPHHNYKFTLRELLEGIADFHLTHLVSGLAQVVVICADDQARVPPTKHAEQRARNVDFAARRKRARVAEAPSAAAEGALTDPATEAKAEQREAAHAADAHYPDDAQLCEVGIRYTDAATQQVREELLDLPRLLHTRSVRGQLWVHLRDHFAAGRVSVPAGTALVLDHFAEGAWVFTAPAASEDHKQAASADGAAPRCRAELRPDLKHKLGEGELMCVYWCQVLRDHAVVVDTIDTDFMALAVNYLATVEPMRAKPLLWRYEHSCHVSMQALTRLAVDHWHMLGHEWLLAVILCGTDYFKKAQLFRQVNFHALFEAVRDTSEQLPHHALSSLDDFRALVALVYRRYLDGKAGGSRNSAEAPVRASASRVTDLDTLRQRAAHYKSFLVASDEEVAAAYATVHQHWQYWNQQWGKLQPPARALTASRE